MKDETKTNAIVEMKCFSLPFIFRKLTQFFSFIGRNDLSKAINERFGTLKWADTQHNLGTNVRLAVFSGLVGNTGAQTAFGYLAVGTSSTAVSASHTTLQAEITDTGLARAASTNSRTTTTQTNDTLVMTKVWTASGTKVVEEVGYFNASSGGVMGGRCLTTTKNLANTDVFQVTYSVQFT